MTTLSLQGIGLKEKLKKYCILKRVRESSKLKIQDEPTNNMNNKSKTILMTTSILTILAVLIVPATLSNEAEATHRNNKCHDTGADGVKSKCYATQHFSVDNTKVITGFKGKIAATDLDIPKGVNQASYWLKFNTGHFIEVGITDLAGTNEPLKFMCGKDGKIQSKTWRTTPVDGTGYYLRLYDYNLDNVWLLLVNGERCNDISIRHPSITPTVNGLERGTETSYNNMNDFVQEFDKTKLRVDGKWKYLSSTFGVEQTLSKVTNGYFVDKCGGTTEKFYHIETGKGVKRNC